MAGEDDLFGAGPSALALKDDWNRAGLRIVPSGTLDLRFVHAGTAIGWEYGGPGLSRYGSTPPGAPGTRESGVRGVTFRMPQIGLDLDFLLQDTPLLHLQLGYDDHPELTGRVGSIGVVKAFAHLPTLGPIALRAGVMIPPVSLEHPGPAWSTRYTLTPSAINTWVGEELRVVGLEGSGAMAFGKGMRGRVVVGLFSHNDTAGAILSWRGWGFHDYQVKLGDRLRTSGDTDSAVLSPTVSTAPFEELDGRPGAYAKLGVDVGDSLKLEVFVSHNFANPRAFEHVTFGKAYGWRTTFVNAAAQYRPLLGLTFLAQALYGTTLMGASAVDNSFASAFLLASYQWGRHRLSFRYDWFQVLDRDANAGDLNDQRGNAQVVAYFFSLDENHTLGVEYLRPVATRVGNTGLARVDAFDDLVQGAYRLSF